MTVRPNVDADIRRATTLPAAFYQDTDTFDAVRERVFVRSWQWVDHERPHEPAGTARPFTLLPGLLDEPLVLTKDSAGVTRCLSNVCTHRANLVVQDSGPCSTLRCHYHGRRFELSGAFRSMPEFEGVQDFPSKCDDLPEVSTGTFGGHRYVSLDPACSFDDWIDPVRQRVGSLPFDTFRHDITRSREYLVHAHWALYVDNYLEGFHIPYVHPDLAQSVDYDSYTAETNGWTSLQLARAKDGEMAFDAPLTPADGASPAAAYYFWLFPNTMLNVYPWGVSVNVVQPLAPNRTKVAFHSFVGRPELLDQGAGGALDKVEREDEDVVEAVQKGVRSRLYKHGRFSAKREPAVHHFHRLMAEALDA